MSRSVYPHHWPHLLPLGSVGLAASVSLLIGHPSMSICPHSAHSRAVSLSQTSSGTSGETSSVCLSCQVALPSKQVGGPGAPTGSLQTKLVGASFFQE